MLIKKANPWYVCFMLSALYLVANIDRFIINLMVEPMKRDFQISDTQVSLLIGITFSLFYVLCGLPIARLADRANRRNILTIGVGAWSLMTAMGGIAQNYWHMFISRMGVGVGEATLAPCAHSILADTLPPEKLGRGFGIYSLGAVLGGAMAYAVGGQLLGWAEGAFPNGIDIPLIGNIFSWQLVFILVGLPGILLAALFFFTVPEPIRSHGGDQEQMSFKEVLSFMNLHRRVYLSIYGGIAAIQIAVGGLTAWLPALFERRFDLGPAESAGYLVVGIVAPGFAAALLAGWLGDRWLQKGLTDSHIRICTIGTLIAIIPFGMAALLPTPVFLVAGISVGILFAFMQAVLTPTALQLVSPARMRSFAASLVMVATILVGAGTGPTIVALITDFGFGDENMLHYSIAIVVSIGTAISFVCFALGRKAYGEMVVATRNASE